MARNFLTKEIIVDSIRTTQIPKDELVVVGGAALQMFGLKRTRDIDAIVSMPTLFERIARRAGGRSAVGGMHSRLSHEEVTPDGIDFFIRDWKDFYESESVGVLSLLPAPNDMQYAVPFEVLRDEAVEMNGILVSPPERILEWKEALGRPKDEADIQRVRAYLAQAAVANV